MSGRGLLSAGRIRVAELQTPPPHEFALAPARDAHQELMRLYSLVVLHMRNTGPLGSRVKSLRPDFTPILGVAVVVYLTPRFLARPLTESHVAKRVSELSDSYLWMLQCPGVSNEAAEWLRARQTELTELHGTLSSTWTRTKSVIKLLPGPAIALVVFYLGGQDLVDSLFHADKAKLTDVLGVLTITTVYTVPLLAGAFNYKRALFLRGPGRVADDIDGADPRWDVYSAEDRLWAVLGLRKSLEPPIDFLVLGWYVLAFYVGLMAESGRTSRIVESAVTAAILVTIAYYWRRRSPR